MVGHIVSKKTEWTAEQVAVLRRNGLQPHAWELRYETHYSLIIHNPSTGEHRLVHKQ